MTVAVHRRSGVRHRIADDDLATRCGRVLHRTRFRREKGVPDCRVCLQSSDAALRFHGRAAPLKRVGGLRGAGAGTGHPHASEGLKSPSWGAP